MAQVRRLGPYAPLSATYYVDVDMIEAGEKAEVLFTRMLAFCSSIPSDGFISDAQLVRIGVGLKGVQNRADALVKAGPLERVPGGYVVRQWLKWNKSADEQERVRTKDRERKAVGNPDGTTAESSGDPNGKPPGIQEPSEPRAEARVEARADGAHHITEQNRTESGPAEPARPDVDQLCNHLAELLVARGCRKPNITDRWREAARLLLDRDNVPLTDALRVLEWSQRDDFWQSNILSLPKFREKYDQLRQQAQRGRVERPERKPFPHEI